MLSNIFSLDHPPSPTAARSSKTLVKAGPPPPYASLVPQSMFILIISNYLTDPTLLDGETSPGPLQATAPTTPQRMYV